MEERKEPTPLEALSVIGKGLANPSLKLSQTEHLTLLACYNLLDEFLKKHSPEDMGPIIQVTDKSLEAQ